MVLPISFFERASQCYFNSVAIFGTQGELMGVYRKSHIPDGPGYEEKYYFSPGETGFRVWPTPFGCVGVGICWDQWFPECARAMALMGADVLLYPTAIGSEPPEAGSLNTRAMWRRAMVGHAVCNAVPVAAANRYGQEVLPPSPGVTLNGPGQSFYGHSFICDSSGELLVACDQPKTQILYSEIDCESNRIFRASMGFFRDRRPALYGRLGELS